MSQTPGVQVWVIDARYIATATHLAFVCSSKGCGVYVTFRLSVSYSASRLRVFPVSFESFEVSFLSFEAAPYAKMSKDRRHRLLRAAPPDCTPNVRTLSQRTPCEHFRAVPGIISISRSLRLPVCQVSWEAGWGSSVRSPRDQRPNANHGRPPPLSSAHIRRRGRPRSV